MTFTSLAPHVQQQKTGKMRFRLPCFDTADSDNSCRDTGLQPEKFPVRSSRVTSLLGPLLVVLQVTIVSICPAATIVGGSNLLDATKANQLEAWLGKGTIQLTNVFSRQPGDGKTSANFHAAVDGLGDTFSIIEDLGAGTPLVGGYNPQSWSSINNYNTTLSDAQRTAFLFNLTNSTKYAQKLVAAPYGEYQTYNYTGYGPTFGGGHDLHINSSLDSGYYYCHSYGPNPSGGTNIVGAASSGTVRPKGRIEVFTVTVTDPLLSSPVPFDFGTTVTVGTYPTNVQAGDLDRDGDADAVVCNNDSNNVTVLFNNGSGVYTLNATLTAQTAPDFCVLADVDKDGDLDIAVSNQSSNSVSILKNNGSGTFAAAIHYAVAATAPNPFAVTTVDYDRDGDLDLALGSSASSNISLLLNNGTGTYTTALAFACGNTPTAIAVADFNKDGWPDLVTANESSNNVSVLRNNGANGVSNRTDYATGGGSRWPIARDLDGDGDADIAVCNAVANSITILNNTGANSFSTGAIYSVGASPLCLVSDDFNADGILDMATSDRLGNTVSILAGYGDGTYVAAQALPVGVQVYGLTSADVDNDGDPDMLTANALTNNTSVLFNKTIHRSDTFPGIVATAACPGGPYGMAVGDFNRDGRPDLATALYEGGTNMLSIQLQDAAGAFPSTVSYSGSQPSIGVVAGDFDRDGDLDLATANYLANNVTIFMNTGSGTFVSSTNNSVGAGPQSVAVGDIDRDGDLDVVSGNNSNNVTALLNNGNGTFAAGVSYNTNGQSSGVALGDLNADGKLDAVTGNWGTDTMSVLIGDGAGAFGAPTTYSVGDEPYNPSIGDLNGDGKMDVVVPNLTGKTVSVMIGNGNGTLQAAVNYPTAPNGAYNVVLKDLNADGSLDMAVAGFTNSLSIFYNSGTGTYAPALQVPLAGISRFVVCTDLNNDGRPDLAVGNTGTNTLATLLNKGGQFALATTSTAPPGGIASGATDDVLSVTLLHRGRSGDSAVELASLHLQLDNGSGAVGSAPLTSAQANAVIAEVAVYQDTNGNGAFNPGAGDSLVATTSGLTLDTSGRFYLPLTDGSALTQTSYGSAKDYFVALRTTANAAGQSPNTARVTHVTSASSKGEDSTNDSSLRLEFAPDTSTPAGGTPLPVTVTAFEAE